MMSWSEVQVEVTLLKQKSRIIDFMQSEECSLKRGIALVIIAPRPFASLGVNIITPYKPGDCNKMFLNKVSRIIRCDECEILK